MDKIKSNLKMLGYLLSFVLFGWVALMYKKILHKDQEILIKDFKLQEQDIEKNIDNSSIDELVDRNNKAFGSGNNDNKH